MDETATFPKNTNSRSVLWRIFLLAVLIRVLFFAVAYYESDRTFSGIFPRYDGYYEIAENLLAGNGFSMTTVAPFVPDSVRTPLYPLFIAGIVWLCKSYYAVFALQTLVGSLIPLFAYRIALQLTSRSAVAGAVALLLACEPLTVSLATILWSETLFTALFLAGVTRFLDYFSEQNLHTLSEATLLFALATLVRPTIQFLPLLLLCVIFFLLWKQKSTAVKHGTVLFVLFFAVLAPWSIRNVIHFQNGALNVQSVSVPYGYLIPSTIALEQHIGFQKAQDTFYAGEGGVRDVGDITLANARDYQKRIAPLLLEHPVGLITSVGVTAFTFFTHDGYIDVLYRWGVPHLPRMERPAFTLLLESPTKAFAFLIPFIKSPILFVLLGRMLWILVTLCFIGGAVWYLRPKENRAKGIFLLLLTGYFVFTTVAVGLAVNARFRIPVNAFILTFAVYGMLGAFSRLRKKKESSLLVSKSADN